MSFYNGIQCCESASDFAIPIFKQRDRVPRNVTKHSKKGAPFSMASIQCIRQYNIPDYYQCLCCLYCTWFLCLLVMDNGASLSSILNHFVFMLDNIMTRSEPFIDIFIKERVFEQQKRMLLFAKMEKNPRSWISKPVRMCYYDSVVMTTMSYLECMVYFVSTYVVLSPKLVDVRISSSIWHFHIVIKFYMKSVVECSTKRFTNEVCSCCLSFPTMYEVCLRFLIGLKQTEIYFTKSCNSKRLAVMNFLKFGILYQTQYVVGSV
ncbi:hypothetical protein BDF20DRAFT_834615 [Mycotypha africana]|uniref:uncharacterized protein n=1 Tax=Mycotypha africana TaxID=64632 RepID=UPI0023006D08|nr:uncharacterized protein BDF20DRAFT_834615 [Mycotypha africana]KAI8981949.1 hypothetical protein BDF20DRAFT_834615 [Mycotypha africana]